MRQPDSFRIFRASVAILIFAPGPVAFAQAQLSTTVGVSSTETGVYTNTQRLPPVE